MKLNSMSQMTATGLITLLIAVTLIPIQAAYADGVMYYVASADYPPVITLTGSATVTLEPGTAYTDAGATATDEEDGVITGRIAVTGSVNTSVLGTYTITYNVTDSAGNAAEAVTRTVRIVDTKAPTISLSGAASVRVEAGAAFSDPGATATDAFEGNISGRIAVTGAVNTAALGVYTLTYNVSDTSGNAAPAVSRTVQVSDTTAPVLVLNGSTPVTIQAGAAYTDAGATATDSFEGNISARITASGTVNTAAAGTYTRTYAVADSSGNAAAPVSRTIIVTVPAKPTITLNGSSTVTVETGTTYTVPAT